MEYYHLALEVSEKALGPSHVVTALVAHNLGDVLERLGENQLALDRFRSLDIPS